MGKTRNPFSDEVLLKAMFIEAFNQWRQDNDLARNQKALARKVVTVSESKISRALNSDAAYFISFEEAVELFGAMDKMELLDRFIAQSKSQTGAYLRKLKSNKYTDHTEFEVDMKDEMLGQVSDSINNIARDLNTSSKLAHSFGGMLFGFVMSFWFVYSIRDSLVELICH